MQTPRRNTDLRRLSDISAGDVQVRLRAAVGIGMTPPLIPL
jgi:hypothetical protein